MKKTAPTRPRKTATKQAQKNRSIYSAGNQQSLPGELVRREGDPPSRDVAVNEAYDGLGSSFDFFWDVYGRNSIDNQGMPLVAVVHYGRTYENAFWNGKQVIVGDGGYLFDRLTSLDLIAKQFANGVVGSAAKLAYWGQSGAIFNSSAVIFSVLVKQWVLRQRADQADWLHGSGALKASIKGRAVSSLAEPGTAYDDPTLGKDPQPGHMRNYKETQEDSGGVHLNSGIPNRAFYLAATAVGGFAWEKAGRIWYQSICDTRLKANASFGDFASITLANARKIYGAKSDEAAAVEHGWSLVGVLDSSSRNTGRRPTAAAASTRAARTVGT